MPPRVPPRRMLGLAALGPPYVLSVSQNGAPPALLRPGAARTIRLDQAGRLDLAAYCPSPRGPAAAAAAGATPVAQERFDYVADPGICFLKFGIDTLVSYASRVDPDNGTAPFVVNNPHQGDVILGPFGPACPPLG